jgi:response regulator RpfG family c-di-GMP phosphodiesterase/tRNA A-37 threonylcarbamoyl transferase component Bud32
LLPSGAVGHEQLLSTSARGFLDEVQQIGLLDAADREKFILDRLDRLREYSTPDRIGQALLHANLLTPHQLERLLCGASHGLVMGSYRILEELGKGGMGTVYLAEHRVMKRRVAVKVLPVDDDTPNAVKQRFYAEMRVLAELSHPNVVLALDAGEIVPERGMLPLIYMVMEYIEGGDLERHVTKNGLCSVYDACNFIKQAAAGLQAAHDQHLVHRDIKPSNLLLTASREIKLVDFGLARQFSSRLTDQRALLGSVEFMAPEQSHDPSNVGREADIYGLGATLFWLLTGEGPYPYSANISQALRALQRQDPRRLRSLRPDAPQELDDLLAHLMDRNLSRRPTSALSVINALRPFLLQGPQLPINRGFLTQPATANLASEPAKSRILIVDDDPQVRTLHRRILDQLTTCECVDARDGQSAIAEVRENRFDLILLDLSLPDADGYELCRKFRDSPENPHLKIVVVSGIGDQNKLSDVLPAGADDYIAKPFEARQLLAKVRHALQLKAAQDKAARLTDQLLTANHQLEQSLQSRNSDLREAHNALLFTVAKIAESRDGETAGHLQRMQRYVHALAVEAGRYPPWQGLVDSRFLAQLGRCVPLHDIGKIGLPDDILLKPASLNANERSMVETHPLIGDRFLDSLSREYGNALDFLGMARTIVRHHHERYDGKGYPDKLSADAIPPAARLVAIADVYDTLRRMRMYKAAMNHAAAVKTITERSEGQFDPTLVQAFMRCHGEFEKIYKEIEE